LGCRLIFSEKKKIRVLYKHSHSRKEYHSVKVVRKEVEDIGTSFITDLLGYVYLDDSTSLPPLSRGQVWNVVWGQV
jgi:hypothetical protein